MNRNRLSEKLPEEPDEDLEKKVLDIFLELGEKQSWKRTWYWQTREDIWTQLLFNAADTDEKWEIEET